MVKLICYIKKYLKVAKILTSVTERIKNIFYLVLHHNIWQGVSNLSGLSHSLSTGHLEKYQLTLRGLAPLMLQDNHYTFVYLIFTFWQHKNSSTYRQNADNSVLCILFQDNFICTDTLLFWNNRNLLLLLELLFSNAKFHSKLNKPFQTSFLKMRFWNIPLGLAPISGLSSEVLIWSQKTAWPRRMIN